MPQINEQQWILMNFKITMLLVLIVMLMNYFTMKKKNLLKMTKKYLFKITL